MPLPKSRKDREQQKFVDDGSGNVAIRVVDVGGGGGGGFTNPMPNGTFLETFTDTAVQFKLAGYVDDLGAAVFGDLVTGVPTSIGTTDDFTTFFSGIAMNNSKTEAFSSDITNDRETVVSWDSASFEFEVKTEDSVANALGFNYSYKYLNDLPADDDVLATVVFAGSESDGVNPVAEVNYAKDIFSIKQVDPTVGGGSTGQLNKYIRANGADFLYETVDNRGTISRAMSNFDAQVVTGGVAYIALETGFASGTYAYGLGGGTTVPGAVANWSAGAIFTDQDATTFNRVWINTGNSTTAAFQRVATLNSNGQLAFEDGTTANPAFSFASSPANGLVLVSANTPAIVANGGVRLQFNSASNIQANLALAFGASTAPTAGTRGLGRGTSDMTYNVATGESHNFSINGVSASVINSVGVRRSTTDSITASATKTQGQQPLTTEYNIVTTVASANNVVTLPTAIAGQVVEVKNEGANTLQVFPASGDSVNNGTVNASVTQATNTYYRYIADDATNWTRTQMTIA
jgi:hypothetical protein